MKRLLLVFILLFAQLFAFAQDGGSQTKKQKKAEAKKEELAKNARNSKLKGIKRHESIQDKATRKRMRKHRKGPIHVDAYDRRPFFIKRWLKKKEH
jgi:Ni/Co efflux regulator RcnB